ncbi:hypothetical protein DC522_32095 [Microvirga sp. KLBC 81]|nr:hypothetical protein DC522_32095 [Microvirga sp. KLBC 81]
MLDVLRKPKGGARKSIGCGSNEFLSVLVLVVIFGPDDWGVRVKTRFRSTTNAFHQPGSGRPAAAQGVVQERLVALLP